MPLKKPRFGDFELDPTAYELRHKGKPVKLERLPMEFLLLLLTRRGELVTRAEIVERLWGKDIFLESDVGINTAVGKIRHALHESADKPVFIQTVTGKGYRFIASVTVGEEQEQPLAASTSKLTNGPFAFAVLPFEDLSSPPGQDYFAAGLTEETIAALGRVNPEQIRVIARTSCMSYRHTTKPVTQIARELGVDYVLEGSVRREGDQLRIVASLIGASDQSQVWNAAYDRSATGFIGVQQELASAICGQVEVRLSPNRAGKNAGPQTRSAVAFDFYLRGRYCWNHLTPPNLHRAIELFQAAVDDDPGFAVAYAGLADAYAYLPLTSDVPPRDSWQKAQAAAERAVQIDPGLSEAHTSLGIVDFWMGWDWAAAESSLRHALHLDANNVVAHRVLAHVLSQTGRHEEAIAQMKIGRELDPFSPVMQAISAQFLFQARRFEEAKERALSALAIDGNFWVAHMMLGQALEQLHETDAAIDEADKAFKLSGGNTLPLALRGYTLATTGRREEALQLVRVMQANSASRFVPACNLALVYAGVGDESATFHWLDRAYAERNVHIVFLTVDPKWDLYRPDRRFHDLLQRAGIA